MLIRGNFIYQGIKEQEFKKATKRFEKLKQKEQKNSIIKLDINIMKSITKYIKNK